MGEGKEAGVEMGYLQITLQAARQTHFELRNTISRIGVYPGV